MRRLTFALASLFLTACASDSTEPPASDVVDTHQPETSPGPDTQPKPDTEDAVSDSTAPDDTSPGDVDTGTDEPISTDALDPRQYCEKTATMFCDYYMRCGRMAANTLEECHRNFAESCNARYEPLYASLAEGNQALVFSAGGMARCQAHLEVVACEAQVSDLDGCPDLWKGQFIQGDRCGPGIESLVCGDGLGCVLDLTFCGTCVPQADTGETCDLDANLRCKDTDRCVDGLCVARGQHGDACTTANDCRISHLCRQGQCVSPTWATLGGSCANGERCPYRSACVSGVCTQTALLGEPCGSAGCASGWCQDGVCAPFSDLGEACSANIQCVTGSCKNGQCASPWCMDR